MGTEMKELGQMTTRQLQKVIDDSLFSDRAWLPSQILLRESVRKVINEHRTSQRFDADGDLAGSGTGSRRFDKFRNDQVPYV